MRLTITPAFVRAVFSGAPLARWAARHPASGLRPGDSLLFVWPQPFGSEPHKLCLKHYGMIEGPGRLEPWAIAELVGDAQEALSVRLGALTEIR